MAVTAEAIASEIREKFLEKPFGIIQFWGFGIVRPNDQFYLIVSTHAEGNRLDLVFVTESRSGLPGILSVWDPEGLEVHEQKLLLQKGSRLRLDGAEASLEGTQFHLKTEKGEGLWPLGPKPSLLLSD